MARTSCSALALVLALGWAGCGEQGTSSEPMRELDRVPDEAAADVSPREAGAPETAPLDAGPIPIDSGAVEEPRSRDGELPIAKGACAGESDRAAVAELGEQLSCEGAACVARNLKLAIPASIDAEATALCVREQAPNLARLSSGCQACFVRTSLCVPESCVALLGAGSNACGSGGVPSSDFERCSAPAAPSAACADCQTQRCQAEFVACSGIEP